jgi:hypothetical protein
VKFRVLRASVVVCALFLSVHAQATEATKPATGKPTEVLPSQLTKTAAAHAKADAAIARAGADDLFENVTDSETPAVRHLASGMVCQAGDDGELSLEIYPGDPRGDDVSCGSSMLGAVVTTYATRYGKGFSARDALEGSIDAIRQRFDDVKPYEHDAIEMSKEGLPQPLTARFEAAINGQKVFTRTSAVEVGEWIVAQRVTAPYDKATAADLVAEVGLAMTLTSMIPGADAAN